MDIFNKQKVKELEQILSEIPESNEKEELSIEQIDQFLSELDKKEIQIQKKHQDLQLR